MWVRAPAGGDGSAGFWLADAEVDEALLDLVWHTPQLGLIVSQRDHRHFRAEACASLDPVRVGPRELLFTDAEIARLLTGGLLALPGIRRRTA